METKTSSPETDESPVVKLPQKANYTAERPSLEDNVPPPSVIVQHPTSSFPDCEPTVADSNVLEPRQCSVVDPLSELVVRLPKLAVSQHASSARSSVVVSVIVRSFFSAVNMIIF